MIHVHDSNIIIKNGDFFAHMYMYVVDYTCIYIHVAVLFNIWIEQLDYHNIVSPWMYLDWNHLIHLSLHVQNNPQLSNMEFGRRLAVERELEKTPYFALTNACEQVSCVLICLAVARHTHGEHAGVNRQPAGHWLLQGESCNNEASVHVIHIVVV